MTFLNRLGGEGGEGGEGGGGGGNGLHIPYVSSGPGSSWMQTF